MDNFGPAFYRRNLSKFRGGINGICFLLLLLLFFLAQEGIFPPPNPNPTAPKSKFLENPFSRRKIYQTGTNSTIGGDPLSPNFVSIGTPMVCTEIHDHKGFVSECEYLKANPNCNSHGFLNYTDFFYCRCRNIKPVGYIALFVWILALFYLLGNTAADYFCFSLEKLSILLKLPPTVAGVTLLPLGNGAPDVFASIAAFMGRDSGEVGLNSVLGGAVFVTCVVVGAVSLCVAEKNIQIDKKCFLRDVGFFLIALVSLLIILMVGKVSVMGAIMFVAVYAVYVLCVGGGEIARNYRQKINRSDCDMPLLPVMENENADEEFLWADYEDGVPHLRSKLPRWMWASNVAVFSNDAMSTNSDSCENPKCLWGWKDEEDEHNGRSCFLSSCLCLFLEVPLAIPRRLTIPVVEEERWSKKYAVASAFFAPILLSFIWGRTLGYRGEMIVYIIGALVGFTLGLLALLLTKRDHPPRKFLLLWVMGGFLMSIVWFYIVANELVSLLVAFGVILKIGPSVLALTVLAWGNSMGDLMSNVAIAVNGGPSGVQIAMSGCYAGPMFNTLVGLGVSLFLRSWQEKPMTYKVPRDKSLFSTLGFLMLGLVWALVVLLRRDMKPGKLLGVGLIGIYLGFLGFRATAAVGDGTLGGLT